MRNLPALRVKSRRSHQRCLARLPIAPPHGLQVSDTGPAASVASPEVPLHQPVRDSCQLRDEDYLGLKVFGTRSNVMAGRYDLNKAVLDRIMASLTVGDR